MTNKETDLGRRSILIIDDEIFIREIYKDVFEAGGFEVDEASDGVIALEMVSDNSYDLVLMDIVMPMMSGVELIKSFKSSLAKRQRPPIIITTNHDLDTLKDLRALYAKHNDNPSELGIVEYVIKSRIDPIKLLGMATKIVDSDNY